MLPVWISSLVISSVPVILHFSLFIHNFSFLFASLFLGAFTILLCSWPISVEYSLWWRHRQWENHFFLKDWEREKWRGQYLASLVRTTRIYFTHLSPQLKKHFIWLTVYGKDALDISPPGKLELIGHKEQPGFKLISSSFLKKNQNLAGQVKNYSVH